MLFSTFAETLKKLRCPCLKDPETRKYIFTSLDLHGCGVISRADLVWLDTWRPVEWVYTDPDPHACEYVKAVLVQEFKYPLRAWRTILDTDDSNNVSWTE